jgi:hypothetical protein
MSTKDNPRVALKHIPTPDARHTVGAPPVLCASMRTIDDTCGKYGTVLMHAEDGRVHNLVIHGIVCGSYNATDA